MEFILNEDLIPLVNNGNLNITKINSLILIKEFIDRIAGTNYLEDRIVEKIIEVHNIRPLVTTWGDYFQTEIAYNLQTESDADFVRAVDTVKFDIISSFEMFSGKDESFIEWVENNLDEKESKKNSIPEKEYEEAIHLNILKEYYSNMRIINNFTPEEVCWYNNFREAVAV